MAQKSDVSATRGVMNGRIGEILTAVIGDDRLQKLYEGRQVPPELAGKPSAEIVLTLKLVPPAVVTALLVAQAAERAVQLAERAEDCVLRRQELREQRDEKIKELERVYHEQHPKSYSSIVRDVFKKVVDGVYPRPDRALSRQIEDLCSRWDVSLGYLPVTDSVFKFVGLDRDPDVLKAAQGTWVAAQMHLNNEIAAVDGMVVSSGTGFTDGLKKRVAGYYKIAADLLSEEGYAPSADKLSQVASLIEEGVQNRKAPSPVELIESIKSEEESSTELENSALAMTGGTVTYRWGFEPERCQKVIALLTLGESVLRSAMRAKALRPATVLQKDTRIPKLRLRKDLFKP